MKCPKIHRYVISLEETDSDVYDTPDEARRFKATVDPKSTALWVAFHEVGIKRLVEHPNSIETYCFEESQRLEVEDMHAAQQLELPTKVNLTKRS